MVREVHSEEEKSAEKLITSENPNINTSEKEILAGVKIDKRKVEKY